MENRASSSAEDSTAATHLTPPDTLADHAIHADHAERVTGRGQVILVFALIVFIGVNLRSVILAIPPVLPRTAHC